MSFTSSDRSSSVISTFASIARRENTAHCSTILSWSVNRVLCLRISCMQSHSSSELIGAVFSGWLKRSLACSHLDVRLRNNLCTHQRLKSEFDGKRRNHSLNCPTIDSSTVLVMYSYLDNAHARYTDICSEPLNL